jgi:hypothetical protein
MAQPASAAYTRIARSLQERHQTQQWETLIARLVARLELPADAREDAKRTYEALAWRIARRLGVADAEVEIFPQGSMRTQTSVKPRPPENFDIDIVARLISPRYAHMSPDDMFTEFGKALEGNEHETGTPEKKRRCWRLRYPGKPFYFDVTPAVPGRHEATGAALRVRDPATGWAPSNPEEFAEWFQERADRRFPFQERVSKGLVETRAGIEPLPDEKVSLDDLLRRAVQIMKLHRNNFYWHAGEARSEGKPISIIIVTLATRAYDNLLKTRPHEFTSPIEVVLAVIEEIPKFLEGAPGNRRVSNPALPAENFADRWKEQGGLRESEFHRWHRQLLDDVERLLGQDDRAATEDRIQSVFGTAGVNAWKESRPKAGLLGGLLGTAAGHVKTNPTAPINTGSRGTLG